MLALGLLISTVTRNQFAASQAALIAAFLPAFELSGFIFEIDSMPAPIRLLTRVLPPRYFVSSLQTLFLAGDVPSVLVPNGLVLAGDGGGAVLSPWSARPGCDWSNAMWQRIRSLIIKELLAVWRDPKSRFILIVPPLIQMLVFAFAATQEVKNVRMAVLNQDMGIYARDLVARFEGSPNFREVRPPRRRGRDRAGDRFAQRAHGRAHPAGLLARAGGRPAGRGAAHPRRPPLQRGPDRGRLRRSRSSTAYNTELAQTAAGRRRRPASVVARVWFNPNLDATWNTVPSLVAILSTLVGLVVTALSVARERELGTFEQLLVSPLSPGEIIVGKTVPAFLIGLAEGTLMVMVGVFFFRVPLTARCRCLYASMARLPARRDRRRAVHFVAGQDPAAGDPGHVLVHGADDALSGFASPVENMPDWLQTLTLANPIRYFIVIVKGVFLKAMPAARS